MFNVKTPDEVLKIIEETFAASIGAENVPAPEAAGRILAQDVLAEEFVPDFDRSTVDGYAVKAADTFGCTDALPALLTVTGRVLMGQSADMVVTPGACAAIPTGGAVPEGADSVVMIEYTEDYGDGTIGVVKSAAPGSNMIFRGDDVSPGKKILSAGSRLAARDIGALAAMGITEVPVVRRPRVAVISTGDELVPACETPHGAQIRDVNSSLLFALLSSFGCEPECLGIVRDEKALLLEMVTAALEDHDMVLISGGSSVGEKDAAFLVINELGDVLLHGIAMKPGKPTILGNVRGKPVFGLPGHPVAAYFVTELFVRAALAAICGEKPVRVPAEAVLEENISANHGRAEYVGVKLYYKNNILTAHPIHSKSGLITNLAGTDGWFCIPRDCEGLAAGSHIEVYTQEV